MKQVVVPEARLLLMYFLYDLKKYEFIIMQTPSYKFSCGQITLCMSHEDKDIIKPFEFSDFFDFLYHISSILFFPRF